MAPRRSTHLLNVLVRTALYPGRRQITKCSASESRSAYWPQAGLQATQFINNAVVPAYATSVPLSSFIEACITANGYRILHHFCTQPRNLPLDVHSVRQLV